MAGLDFRRAADLFMATEPELASALGIEVEAVRTYRDRPNRAPDEVLARFGRVLTERGRGMLRVGEMLLEQAGGAAGGNGRGG